MSLPFIKIKDCVEKVSNWNPITEAPDQVIDYVDLSAVDKDSKAVSDVIRVEGKSAPSRARQLVKADDILVSTVRPNLNGVAKIDSSLNGATASTGFTVLRARRTVLDPNYLFHWVKTSQFINDMVSKATGQSYPAVSDKTVLNSEIPLHPLEEQRRIASILDKADEIRQKRQQAIAKLDELLQATFIDMFGDPVSNPKKWPIKSLKEFGNFKNGLNYGKGESGVTRKYIGVGNFKNFSKLDDIESLGSIKLNNDPSKEYFLKDGDLLFVRSNGNKELVGRCMAVYPKNDLVTYSGFCIRYRIEKDGLTPEYLSHLFRSESFRSSILKAGQGANIQNINQQSLSELLIPIPPEELLSKWSIFLNQIEKQKLLCSKELEKDLFISLQQKAFNGTL
ncbi:restriction endonuclease subunit S [Acinetobacter sp. GXMZU3951]